LTYILNVEMLAPTHSSISLWIGFGFNPGSALILGIDQAGEVAATAAVNTALSGAAGGITALFTNLYIVERSTGEPHFSLLHAMNGSLSGLVAITSGCGVVEPWAAIVIGTIAGWIYLCASSMLIRLRIDDAVDAIPVHMFNGIWGVLATGFFASPRLIELAYNGTGEYSGLFYGNGRAGKGNLLGCQFTLVIFILGWVFVTMMPFFIWLNYQGWFRADSLEELVGLDVSYHGRSVDNEDGDVKEEYIEAFKKQRGSLRSRRVIQSRQVNCNFGDPELDQEAAAREAFEDSK
jgi:Amt family ammonium transporter